MCQQATILLSDSCGSDIWQNCMGTGSSDVYNITPPNAVGSQQGRRNKSSFVTCVSGVSAGRTPTWDSGGFDSPAWTPVALAFITLCHWALEVVKTDLFPRRCVSRTKFCSQILVGLTVLLEVFQRHLLVMRCNGSVTPKILWSSVFFEGEEWMLLLGVGVEEAGDTRGITMETQ